jgi:UDP-N-acetylglucosamine--N-acetylmuramyl-(pentapeptide) pyrophosphoryl-undecaprenol N-acetylglucosamine transferase
LSLARELKKSSPNCLIIYIGLKGEKLDRLSDEYSVFDRVYYVTSGKFRRYFGESVLSHLFDVKTLLLNARDFFKVIIGIFGAGRILRYTKPDVVFSKGGFVAVPVGIAARMQGISIVTHDSDTVPGLANRIVGRWARIHATGMPAEYYKYPKDTTRFVGIPLKEAIVPVDPQKQMEYKTELGIPADKKVILVAGGGLGAKSLNESVIAMAPELFRSNPDSLILHFTGAQHAEEVQNKYQASLSDADLQKVRTIGFSPDYYKYSGAADLVITRAGATSLAELSVQGKACIVIPSPFLTGGHQVKNAHRLNDMDAVETLPNNATPHELYKLVDRLLNNESERARLAVNLSKTAKMNAAGELAGIILEVAAKSSK